MCCYLTNPRDDISTATSLALYHGWITWKSRSMKSRDNCKRWGALDFEIYHVMVKHDEIFQELIIYHMSAQRHKKISICGICVNRSRCINYVFVRSNNIVCVCVGGGGMAYYIDLYNYNFLHTHKKVGGGTPW